MQRDRQGLNMKSATPDNSFLRWGLTPGPRKCGGKGGKPGPCPTGLRQYEKDSAGLPKERGTIMSHAGDLLATLEQSGDATELNLTDEQEAKSGGAYFTHNHPGGGALSAGDFFQAGRLNMQQMRAVGVDEAGKPAVHIIERPANGWPGQMEMQMAYTDASVEAMGTLREEESRSGVRYTNKVGRKLLADRTARLLADKLNIPYTVEEL